MHDEDHRTIISSFNQTGGITAHTVNINPAHRQRTLSPEQNAQLFLLLKDAEKAESVIIECPMAAGNDAIAYGDAIYAALKNADWNVREPFNSTRAPVIQGVELVQRNRGVAIPPAVALLNAFRAVGITLTPFVDTQNELPENHLRICIGSN